MIGDVSPFLHAPIPVNHITANHTSTVRWAKQQMGQQLVVRYNLGNVLANVVMCPLTTPSVRECYVFESYDSYPAGQKH